ncbi:MAG: DUF362 domain-containing protein [Opitutaceae bacterium]|jgi:hypothetical protein|nr:DUF362 domain-containing protein [Opitutaceae bacterium]
MRFVFHLTASLALLCAAACRAAEIAAAPPAPPATVFQARLADFSAESHAREVELLFAAFEKSRGGPLVPSAKGKVGLKIYTDSGPGLATPVPLALAVIRALERRGWAREDIFLVGLSQRQLRLSGYLGSHSLGPSPFEGHKIYVLESGRYFDPVWFYDNPLPSRFDPIHVPRQAAAFGENHTGGLRDEDRKSFLATPLFVDTDFWINLPAYSDHPMLGVNGALANATLWNASNTSRFFNSLANASAAVAEMAAIPELRRTMLFTLASLERYQFIGGPQFNSYYTISEPILWLSNDPVILDALMLRRINAHRGLNRFKPVSGDIRALEFAAALGVGSRDTDAATLRDVDSLPPPQP